MPSLRKTALIVALGLALSSCQMTVRISTQLDGSGGGTFSIAMIADRELRAQLEDAPDAASGLSSIQELFADLRDKGWSIAETEPDGGLALEASRTFANPAEFGALLGELRSARGGTDQLGDIKLNLDYSMRRSFLRTQGEFRGEFDTAALDLPQDLIAAIRDLVRFEVRAELPGAISVGDGSGVVGDGRVVWRPDLGQTVRFSAESSAVRVGSLLMILIPALALLSGVVWFAVGRRRPDEPLRALEPDAREAEISDDTTPGIPAVGARAGADKPAFLAFHPEPIDRRISLEETIALEPEPEPALEGAARDGEADGAADELR